MAISINSKHLGASMHILELNGVELTYFDTHGETKALEDITFSVDAGEFVSIVGPSGCGKTTILSIITGLIQPTHGKVNINGQGSKVVGYMFQKDNLLEWRTIKNNICLGLELTHNKTKENLDYVDELLKKYNLWDFRDKYPRELSGGMRQRAALIRTLALRPSLLLLDEAFSALDYQTRLNVCDDVYNIIKQEKLTAILVTHDINEAISLSDKVVILSKRPSSVKEILDISLQKYPTPFERRECVEAKDYFQHIWEKLV